MLILVPSTAPQLINWPAMGSGGGGGPVGLEECPAPGELLTSVELPRAHWLGSSKKSVTLVGLWCVVGMFGGIRKGRHGSSSMVGEGRGTSSQSGK